MDERRSRRGLHSHEERVLRLLSAQRRQDVSRSSLRRGSPVWQQATARLDRLNVDLMHAATSAGEVPDPLGNGVDLDLDSQPEEDVAFRRSVLRSFRLAVRSSAIDDLAARTVDRLHASEDGVRASLDALTRAQSNLRAEYPDATLDGWASEASTISVLADRDGKIA